MKYPELANIPTGDYCVDVNRPWWRWWQPKERGGWLIVYSMFPGETSVMWMTDRYSHFRYGDFGCACSISLKADGTLIAYLESHVTMCIVWGYGRGDEDDFRRAVDFANWAKSRLCGVAPQIDMALNAS